MKRLKMITRCLHTYPNAYVRSEPKDGSRWYWILTPDSTGRPAILSSGHSPTGAWQSLYSKLQRTVTIMNANECDKEGKLQDVFDSFNNITRVGYSKQGIFTVRWSEKGRGFGEYSFFKNKSGQWELHNEGDGREEIKRVLCRLVDSLPLVTPVEDK